MSSSSYSSRIKQASGVSPFSTLPPGNSHIPARCLPCGLLQMSTRPSTSTRAAAATSRISVIRASGAVVAVDFDVAFGQVAGPDYRRGAPDADIDADLQLRPLHVGAHPGLDVGRRDHAILGGDQIAEAHAHAIAIDRLVRPADGHDDAAP